MIGKHLFNIFNIACTRRLVNGRVFYEYEVLESGFLGMGLYTVSILCLSIGVGNGGLTSVIIEADLLFI